MPCLTFIPYESDRIYHKATRKPPSILDLNSNQTQNPLHTLMGKQSRCSNVGSRNAISLSTVVLPQHQNYNFKKPPYISRYFCCNNFMAKLKASENLNGNVTKSINPGNYPPHYGNALDWLTYISILNCFYIHFHFYKFP